MPSHDIFLPQRFPEQAGLITIRFPLLPGFPETVYRHLPPTRVVLDSGSRAGREPRSPFSPPLGFAAPPLLLSLLLPFLPPAAFLLEGSRVAGCFLRTARWLGARTSEAAGLGNPAAWLRRPGGEKKSEKIRCGTHAGGRIPRRAVLQHLPCGNLVRFS